MAPGKGRRRTTDPRLRDRRRIAEVLEALRGQDLTRPEMEDRLRPLRQMGDQVVPVLLEQFEEGDEEMLFVAACALKVLNDRQVVEPLTRLLRSSRVDDLAKGLILSLLEHYGLDVHNPAVVGTAIDIESILSEGADRSPDDRK